jgi:hypothetical protein
MVKLKNCFVLGCLSLSTKNQTARDVNAFTLNNNNNNNMMKITITTTKDDATAAPWMGPLFVLSQDFQYFDLERTGDNVDHNDESAVSASLYLNPVSSKLAPDVQISW